ncbi:MAG: Exodeoxyribonuclease 7 small subunit [Chlamydiae bacterium]|nr:Exodeoxyribonuclease 7 small subunit [Chlamydiota bacterium]
MEENTQTFEEAYLRLENILEQMNSEQVSLDDALSYYEEADKLIATCQKRLMEAEQKIETLMKNRDNTLSLGSDGEPQTEPFSPPKQSALQE